MAKKTKDLRLWHEFRRAHSRATTNLENEMLDRMGFPLIWFDTLHHLSEAPRNKLRLQDLADKLLFSRTGLTRLVDRIEEAGLVEREPDQQDRRGISAVLTSAGLQTHREAVSTYDKVIESHFLGPLNTGDRKALRSALRKVLST